MRDSSRSSMGKNLLVTAMMSRWVEAMIRPLLPPLLPVFMLHHFRNSSTQTPGHDPQLLSDCLKKLKKQGYGFVDLDEALDSFNQQSVSQHKVVAFTLDDGFMNQVMTAHEVFSVHRCPFTCFLITDFMDGKSWPWDAQVSYLLGQSERESVTLATAEGDMELSLATPEAKRQAAHTVRGLMKADFVRKRSATEEFLNRLSTDVAVRIPVEPPTAYRSLDWVQARDLEHKGVRFGAHGLTHHILSALDEAEARDEILLSRKKINEELEKASDIFCYPVGRKEDFSEREIKLVAEAGYKAAVSAVPGHVTPEAVKHTPFALPRFTFPDSMVDFCQYVSWVEHVKSSFR